MSIFAGTTIASAGIESLSTIPRKVSEQICTRNRATLSEQSTIEIFDNGSVRENLMIEMHSTLRFVIEFIDGRLTGFTSITNGDSYAYARPADAINIWLRLDACYYEMQINHLRDNQEESYRYYMGKLEEIQLLNEMMWDTDNDFPPAAWGRLTELGF